MKKLLVLGSSNIDHVVHVPRFPKPGETLAGSDYQVHFGGKGANQAVAAARAGASTAFITCLGTDALGQQLQQSLLADGIAAEGIESHRELPSGIAMIQIDAAGENQIVLSAGANGALNAQLVDCHQQLIEQSGLLLMQLETPLDGIIKAAEIASQAGVTVALNPAPACELPVELYHLLDWITPNQTEAELLSGIAVTDEKSADTAAQWFHQQGVANVMITLGADGVWISCDGQGEKVSGFKVDAVDTVAAGDTFNGAFFTQWLKCESAHSCAKFAHAAAALAVTRAGAQSSIPDYNEINSFLTENVD